VIARVIEGSVSQRTVRYGSAGIIGSSIAWMTSVGTVIDGRKPREELTA
jgi:hypothetical protein